MAKNVSKSKRKREYYISLEPERAIKLSSRRGIITASSKFETPPRTRKTLTKHVKDEVRKAHRVNTERALEILKEEIIKSGAVATGEFLDTASVRVQKEKEDRFSTEIYFEGLSRSEILAIDLGRAGGKPPPLGEILKWTVAKGLPKPERAAAAIQVAIARGESRGIVHTGHRFLDRARHRIQDLMHKRNKRLIKKLL